MLLHRTLLVGSLLFTSSFAAAAAPTVQPDTVTPPVAAPHFALELGMGPSVTSVDLGTVKYVSLHGHFDAFIGHELGAWQLGNEPNRVAVGFGYMGSVDANNVEILHRHGVAFSFTNKLLYVTVGGGVALLQGFNGDFFAGPGLTTSLGLRIGKFQMALPIAVDVLAGTAATTFAFTLGYAN